MRISDWSSDVCSSDLGDASVAIGQRRQQGQLGLGVLGDDDGIGHGGSPGGAKNGATSVLRARPVVGPDRHNPPTWPEIGRASCRERVCQYVYISVVAV